MNQPGRSPKHIGISQFAVSNDPTEILMASSLGSCLGMAVFDRIRNIAGMIHCLVPLAKNDLEKAKLQPAMYVETGVPMLLDMILRSGSNKKDLEIIIAGCAQINSDNSIFEIGKKNLTVCKKILWKNGLLIKAEHCGGDFSRTLSLEVASGRVTVKAQGVLQELSEGRI